MRSLIKIPQYSCYNAYERLDTLFLQHDTLGQKKRLLVMNVIYLIVIKLWQPINVWQTIV